MNTEPILVIGAGGQVGAGVVEQLLAAGATVRASARNPEKLALPAGVEVVQADLAQPQTLPAALAGVRKVFLYALPQGIGDFLEAAALAGVEHLVLLSSQTVVDSFPEQKPITDMHQSVEAAIVASGIAYTFLRPHNFATNILMWGWPQSIRAEGKVSFPYPESHSDAIHEKDIAAVAVAALTEDGHQNQAYFISGPESVTQRRQLEIIGEALGRPLVFDELTDAQARQALEPIVPVWVMDAVVGYWAHSDGVPTHLSDTVERITGRPARGFADWVADHLSDFTG